MKKKIIDILNDHSSNVTIHSAIVTEGEKEDQLWSGEFDEVADKIITLFAAQKTPAKTKTDPRTMQLIAQLIYTIEEQLDPLHPIRRHSNSFLTLKKQTK